jgi:hypothetical protein
MENLTSHLNQLSETLNKRNLALKDIRTVLQKTEEERDENWRKLQLEIREKRALANKLKELSDALEASDQRLRQSESARKAMSKTLQKFSTEVQPPAPAATVGPTGDLEEAYTSALAEIAALTAKLGDERSKRRELRAALKQSVEEVADLSDFKREALRQWMATNNN